MMDFILASVLYLTQLETGMQANAVDKCGQGYVCTKLPGGTGYAFEVRWGQVCSENYCINK